MGKTDDEKDDIEKDTKKKESGKGDKPRSRFVKRACITIIIFIIAVFVLSLMTNNGIFEINWFGVHIKCDIEKTHNMLINFLKNIETWMCMVLIVLFGVGCVCVVEGNKTKRTYIKEEQRTERENLKEKEKTERERIKTEREVSKLRNNCEYEGEGETGDSKEREKKQQ